MGNTSLFNALIPSAQDYYNESPFYGTGVNILRNPSPVPQNSTQALLLPILQGLAGGTAMGYGEASANKQAQSDLSRLGSMISGNSYELPEGVTARNAQGLLANMLLNQQFENQKELVSQKASNDLSSMLLKEYGAVIDPQTGQINKIPGLQQLAGKDWYSKLPSASQTQAGQIQGVTSELEKLASDFATLDQPAIIFQPSAKMSGTRANELISRMNTLVPTVVRMMGDVGNLGQQEQQRIIEATIGNITSGSQGAATRLKNLANTAKNLSKSRLETLRTAITEGGDALLADLNKPNEGIFAGQQADSGASLGIPEGAVSTGRTSGGKPVYRLPSGQLWVE